MTTPMFDKPEPEEVELSERFDNDEFNWDVTERMEKLSYTRRNVKSRERCQECIMFLFEHNGRGPLPRQTKMRRTLTRKTMIKGKIKDLKITLDLCSAHARLWKERDGVE